MTLTATLTKTTPNIEQDRNDIRRGSTISLLGFVVRLGARVPFLLIAGRSYGTTSYGEYVLLTAIVETIALLSSFGLKRMIFSFIDADPRQSPRVIRHALAVVLGLSLLLMALLQGLAHGILSFFSASEISSTLVLLAWAIPLISLTDACLSATLSRRVMRYEVVVRSLVEPITLTVMSFLFYMLGFIENGLVYAFLGAFGLAALVSAFLCWRVFGSQIFIGGLEQDADHQNSPEFVIYMPA